MKRVYFSIAILCSLMLVNCQENKSDTAEVAEIEEFGNQDPQYSSFGEAITDEDAITAQTMSEKYAAMKEGDTTLVTLRATVNEVCQAKGCWMKLDFPNGQEAMVKFKDYGFFVPKDISGKEVVIRGNAFVEEMSIEEQKHYAEDEGKSQEEIKAITQPKKTYSFIADGVLLKEG